jgi:hypothetical protein
MTEKELKTLKTFVTSNNSFSNALKNNEPYLLDFPIIVELIIYYLTLNKEDLINLNITNREIFLSLISNHNYILEENYILIGNIKITINTLKELVNKIEEQKNNPTNRIIYFTNNININRETKLHRPQKGQVIQFKEAQRSLFFTTLERATIFERTTRVDNETLPYINRTKNDFIALANDIILKAINSNLDNYNKKYLKVIASYLNLYPFIVYANNKISFSFKELSISQNEIGLRKSTYNVSTIKEIEKKLEQLIIREEKLVYEREKYELDLSINTNLLTRIEQELMNIEKEKTNYFVSLYLLRTSPEVYNENLIMYLKKSFESGYVEINRFLVNPLIKLFYIKNNKTEFYSAMRLETLINLFDSNILLEQLEPQRQLVKKR